MAKGKSITDNVKYLLSNCPKTRGDDKLLIVAYWRYFDKLHVLDMNFVRNATPAESITRARRIIQAKGMYLPSEEIVNARKNREIAFKDALRNGDVI